MKIKYIGNFTDGTEWAKAATYNAMALHAAGHDVYCEEKKYNQLNIVLENDILDLMNKQSSSFDVVIQHILPIHYKYMGESKNISYVPIENYKFTNVAWLKNIKMMDDVFVPSSLSQSTLKNSGIQSKIFPGRFNIDKVQNHQKVANIPELNNTFNFMFAGDFSQMKNIEALLIAFHNEFHYKEPVNLYIKTIGKPLNEVQDFCKNVKNKMKKTTRYKNEIIVSDLLEENALWSTMSQCHAFVMPSRGEALCYPAMEAQALGIPVIYAAGTGLEDYCDKEFSVSGILSPCYGDNGVFQDLNTSNDLWIEISILDLQAKLRKVYNSFIENNGIEYKKFKDNCISRVQNYDYRNKELIGELI